MPRERIAYAQQLQGRLTAVGPGIADVELAGGGVTPLGPGPALASQLVFVTERSFREEGTIAFDGAPALRFTTLGRGDLADSPQRGLRHGTAVLEVWGIGSLSGARGRITSNFLVGEDGVVTDEQVVVLFIHQEGGQES